MSVKRRVKAGNWTPEGAAERAAWRRDFRELTPIQRVEQVFELSRFLSQLAQAGPGDAIHEIHTQAILRELVDEGVEFLLAGAVAAGYHGYIRGAAELDVVPALDPDNLQSLKRVIEQLDARVEGDLRQDSPIFATRLGRIHVMQRIGDFHLWEELSPAAIDDFIGDLPIKIASYEDLVRLKELTGRPEDLADLQRLREARES
ncbi:MAG TPA: hypothetical protein VNN15_09580 [Solirubrobacterales bacterium]|nr:hypothetical protein [Solirubrobacterales bacterium]